MKNIMQRLAVVENKETDDRQIKILECRIDRLEEIIESLGYYFPKPKK
jgi:endonuclease III-like uncharacterized protein